MTASVELSNLDVAVAVTDVEEAKAIYRHEIGPTERKFYYGRFAQSEVNRLERDFAALHGADHALCVGTGMAAVNLVTTVLMTQREAAHAQVLGVVRGTYYETERRIRELGRRLDVPVAMIEPLAIDDFLRAVGDSLLALWVETPSNPLLWTLDIASVGAAVRRHAPAAVLVVDNSMLPILQRPLDLGADVEIVSLTKFAAGENDLMGGLVITRSLSLAEMFRAEMDTSGAIMGASIASQFRHRVEGLQDRIGQHCRNAALVADRLRNHPAIARIAYPLLEDTCIGASADLIAKQMGGVGGSLIAIWLEDGDAGDQLMRATASRYGSGKLTRVCVRPTFGQVTTHLEHFASFERKRTGLRREETIEGMLGPGFCRIAVGLGTPEQIYTELRELLDEVIPFRLTSPVGRAAAGGTRRASVTLGPRTS